jgi:hypothetical protein
MRPVLVSLMVVLAAGGAFAQESGGYATAENPYQGEHDFAVGRAVPLRVDVQGMRFDAITAFALEDVRAGAQIRCEVQATGSNAATGKGTVTMVLLLEDANGRGMDRITLDSFKVKNGKPFDVRQKVSLSGDSLTAAAKVYVFVQVVF